MPSFRKPSFIVRLASFLILVSLLSTIVLVLPSSVEAAGIQDISPSSGEVGKLVTVTGIVSCGQDYEIYWDSVRPENLITRARSSGCRYAVTQIKIPMTSKGKHRVILIDLYTNEEASYDFSVIPEISGSEKKGSVGTILKLTGTGFAANEEIKAVYDKVSLKDTAVADDKGSFTLNVSIPSSFKGNHYIQAEGNLTSLAEVGYIPFEVTPGITLDRATGGSGSTIVVSGTGFAANEPDIRVTFDGQAVVSGLVADASGSFKANFMVPSAAKNDHSVDALGANTKATDVPNVLFVLGTAIVLDPPNGHVGDKINVLGSGFGSGETDIKIFYGTEEASTGVKADGTGIFEAVLTVPASIVGDHPVSAAGMLTNLKSVSAQSFTVLPQLSASPKSGGVGTSVDLSGTGFAPGKAITVTYDGQPLNLSITSDDQGSFKGAKFKAPDTSGKQHLLVGIDGDGNKGTGDYFTDVAPPFSPSLVYPEVGQQVGAIGKQKVRFEWSPVSDPSGVFYDLEVSPDQDFAKPVLQINDLKSNTYTLKDDQPLEHGSYYWRVRTVSGVNLESGWSDVRPFTVSRVSMEVAIILVVALLIVMLGIIWWFTPLLGRNNGGGSNK